MATSINQPSIVIEQTVSLVDTFTSHLPDSTSILSTDTASEPSPINSDFELPPIPNEVPATMDSDTEIPQVGLAATTQQITLSTETEDETPTLSGERDQHINITPSSTSEQVEPVTSLAQPEVEGTVADSTMEASTAITANEAHAQDSPNTLNTDSPSDAVLPADAETEDTTSGNEDEIPEWVKYEEDTSIPDAKEMEEIEGSEYDKLSAVDVKAVEEQFFLETDDPEQIPVKKLRLSWTIRGVRGTRERPNYARVMNSPAACVDGLYWSIKFYPRGDNCNSLSAFVRCSREPPPVDEECPESEFSFYQGAPDADFSSSVSPEMEITIPAKDRIKSDDQLGQARKPELEESKKQAEAVESENLTRGPHTASRELGSSATIQTGSKDTPNWRVSAQLGVVIYNPSEPRTGHLQSDGHQFSKFCDDWGWVSFVGPWDEIHRRKRGQRQALLRNDTLAIDAYIQIYKDPTEALWWHESKDESQWPSKELAGYFSMGTPGLYHSPAVAGITAWFLMAPFRNILQNANSYGWQSDSSVDPNPFICQSQLVLDQMRNLSTDCYVNLHHIIEECSAIGENFHDVVTFWEVFRRGLELELADDSDALQKISSIFDAGGRRWTVPSLPVPGSDCIQEGLNAYFDGNDYHGALPNFLPVMLNRSAFDKTKREWKLHHNRVKLDDELELSKWCSDPDSKFVLYGFIVHVGPRNSGKFYTVLRPGGIGSKWLAFEDGNGNKVFSYSKKRIQEFEGLDDEELRTLSANQVRENAYMAMYIRSTCIESYLPGTLEPYPLPKWLKPYSDTSRDSGEESNELPAQQQNEATRQIELYLDECAEGAVNMLELHQLRKSSIAQTMCRNIKVRKDLTLKHIRSRIARKLDVSDPHRIIMLEIRYHDLGKHSRATLKQIPYRHKVGKCTTPGEPYRIWLAVQQPVGEKASYQHLLGGLDDLDPVRWETAKDDSAQPPILLSLPKETVDDVDDIDIERLTAMIDAEHDNNLPDGATVEEDILDVAAADEEQASIANAVAADLQNMFSTQNFPASNDESAITIRPTEVTEDLNSDEDVTMQMGDVSDNVDGVPVGISTADAELSLPVVHGHMVEAAQHIDGTIAAAEMQSSIEQSHIPINAPLSLILEGTPSPDGPSGSGVANTLTEVSTNSWSSTAAVHIPRAYCNIQLFDADQQIFLAQRPFHPELDLRIDEAVRRHLGYEDTRKIRIWKRQGFNDVEALNATSTFANAEIQDVFTFIVGDVLSETRCEDLKAAGKFTQPQQLIAYLGMLQRKHPHATITSSDPVEIADYGNDYYKGPLCRGRPHGENGLLITSTGHTYVGPFVAGQKSGSNGKMTYQNGDTYVGDWLDDERHGQGEHKELRTGNRYVGGFEKGKRWGQGVTYWQVADQQADMCQICYEEEIDALFFDCGHVCACVACAKQCETCPLCRRNVAQVVKMYRA